MHDPSTAGRGQLCGQPCAAPPKVEHWRAARFDCCTFEHQISRVESTSCDASPCDALANASFRRGMARLWSCRPACTLGLAVADPAFAKPLRAAWSVGELISTVATMLQTGFPACTVQGEISGFLRAGSGHCYFNLKDPEVGATLRCAMFRRAAQLSGFDAREGDAVELRGRLVVYEPRGELQFVVESMQRSGSGALYERFPEAARQARGRGPLRRSGEAQRAGVRDADRRRHLACRRRTARRRDDAGPALAARVRRRLSQRRPGQRCAIGLVRGHRSGRRQGGGRRARRLSRRRLARRPLGLQRGMRRSQPSARHRCR